MSRQWCHNAVNRARLEESKIPDEKENYGMKGILLVVVALLFVVLVAFAADKPYQVARPVLEVTANWMVVQKGKKMGDSS